MNAQDKISVETVSAEAAVPAPEAVPATAPSSASAVPASELRDIAALQKRLRGARAEESLKFVAENFPGKAVFSTSLSAEDQIITDIIARFRLPIPIVTLDTGRLFDETYALLAETEKFFGLRIRVFSPDTRELEAMVRDHGINLFRESIELRRLCCRVRKIGPLHRALCGNDIWICGQRREQSVTRSGIDEIEADDGNGMLKLNPLAAWSSESVRSYVALRGLPYNRLHDRGFPSIGCACCTRAVRWTEDFRAGRWWWEPAEKRECGLHGHNVRD